MRNFQTLSAHSSDMQINDSYLTVASNVRIELVEQKSRFIGETFLVESSGEISNALDTVTKREHAASHHCYAWRLGRQEPRTFKYSDDGEPNGTAGRPLHDLLIGRNLTNSMIVVTRYFGGTKLGTGGLARAYAETGKRALEAAGEKERYITQRVRMSFEIGLYDRWLRMIESLRLEKGDVSFTDHVAARLAVRIGLVGELKSRFVELTAGRGEYEEETD